MNNHEQKRHQCRMGRAFGQGAAMGRRSGGQAAAEEHEHQQDHCGQGQGRGQGQGKGRCCRHGLARKAGNSHCTGHEHGQESCSCKAGLGDAAPASATPDTADCTA